MNREEQIKMWEQAAGVQEYGKKKIEPKRPGGTGRGYEPIPGTGKQPSIPKDPKTGKDVQ